MNIALIYHKDPYSSNPRGGELSVRAIVEYLSEKGHHIALANGPSEDIIKSADVVLTWGNPAFQVAHTCKVYDKKMVLMVRFWKNIAPLPAGNLIKRDIDTTFQTGKSVIFKKASAIITNTKYAKNVIRRWQPVSKGKVHVSYVPILGQFEEDKKDSGKILIVTPEIYGEIWLVKNLAEQLPKEEFLVVNADFLKTRSLHHLPNVTICGYTTMRDIWRQTKCLLVPVYDNDICGTRRVTIEAFRNHTPVIASDKCGMSEKVPPAMLVSRNAKISEWVEKINEVNENYNRFQNVAKKAWERYDTPAQLAQFEKILLDVCGY